MHSLRNKFQFGKEDVLSITWICSRRLFTHQPHVQNIRIRLHSMSLMRSDFRPDEFLLVGAAELLSPAPIFVMYAHMHRSSINECECVFG